MRTLVISILLSLLTNTFVLGQERSQQPPVVVYAVDLGDDNDPDLDIVSEDIKMYENATEHGLARKIVIFPITNWPVSEHTFKHEGQRYSVSMPNLELKKL